MLTLQAGMWKNTSASRYILLERRIVYFRQYFSAISYITVFFPIQDYFRKAMSKDNLIFKIDE